MKMRFGVRNIPLNKMETKTNWGVILDTESKLNDLYDKCRRNLRSMVRSAQDEKRYGEVSVSTYAQLGLMLKMMKMIKTTKADLVKIIQNNKLGEVMGELQDLMSTIAEISRNESGYDVKKLLAGYEKMEAAADSSGRKGISELTKVQRELEVQESKKDIPVDVIYDRTDMDRLIAGASLEDVLRSKPAASENIGYQEKDMDDILAQLDELQNTRNIQNEKQVNTEVSLNIFEELDADMRGQTDIPVRVDAGVRGQADIPVRVDTDARGQTDIPVRVDTGVRGQIDIQSEEGKDAKVDSGNPVSRRQLLNLL